MTPREMLGIGVLLLMFVLLGIVWYSMTLHPDKYRHWRTWLYLTVGLFLLYIVFLLLLIGRSDLEGVLLAIIFSLFGSILTAIGMWIPMREKTWIREWLDSRRGDRKAK